MDETPKEPEARSAEVDSLQDTINEVGAFEASLLKTSPCAIRSSKHGITQICSVKDHI